MNVWYAIPTANPARARACFAAWRAQGYKLAVVQDPGVERVDADVHIEIPYPGYFEAVNVICKLLVETYHADIVVTGGDDIAPDPKKTAQEIGREFLERFPGGFGVMQPTGDSLYGTDRICGSPWFGRGWIRRAYGGEGPYYGKYRQFYGDTELKLVAERLGLLWQRKDLVQYHDHHSRQGGPPMTDYQRENEKRYLLADRDLFLSRREADWPGAGSHS